MIFLNATRLWQPVDVSLSLWLDASDSSTITTVSGAVSEWRDKSGNLKHCSQSVSNNRPILTTAGRNGLNTITFDGSDDFLEGSSSITPSGTYTGAMMVFWAGTRLGSGGVILCDRLSTLFGDFEWWNLYISSDGANVGSNHQVSSAVFNLVGASGGMVSHLHVPGQRDQLWVNGSSQTVDTGTASNITGTNGYRIGSRGNAVVLPYNGDLWEIIATNQSPPVNTRQQIEGYLAHKWGLASNLPSGHPFKNNAPRTN